MACKGGGPRSTQTDCPMSICPARGCSRFVGALNEIFLSRGQDRRRRISWTGQLKDGMVGGGERRFHWAALVGSRVAAPTGPLDCVAPAEWETLCRAQEEAEGERNAFGTAMVEKKSYFSAGVQTGQSGWLESVAYRWGARPGARRAEVHSGKKKKKLGGSRARRDLGGPRRMWSAL